MKLRNPLPIALLSGIALIVGLVLITHRPSDSHDLLFNVAGFCGLMGAFYLYRASSGLLDILLVESMKKAAEKACERQILETAEALAAKDNDS